MLAAFDCVASKPLLLYLSVIPPSPFVVPQAVPPVPAPVI